MRAVAIALAAVALFGIANTARAADDNKELVVGMWEIAYSDDPKSIPVGTRLEFTKEGKMQIFVKDADGKEKMAEPVGYRIDKEYLVITGKDGSKNDKGRICLLNKTSFIIKDEIEDKVIVLKRVNTK